MSTELIRVLIADDHPIVRQGLEIVINSQPDMKLVGQASNGEEALALAHELKPDVIVLDLKMPVKNGLMAIQELRASDARIPILVLTSFPDNEMVITAIQSGANGVMLKDSPPEQLLNAIRDVLHGKSALHPSVAHQLLVKVQQSAAITQGNQTLTKREIDVLKCLAQGYSNQKIAVTLSISTRTVTTHIRNILDKLGLENRTQAGIYAVQYKIAP
jgi:DNA-binding NarL/FixJ family response regulator